MTCLTSLVALGDLPRPTSLAGSRSIGDRHGRIALAAIVAVVFAQMAFLLWGCDWDLCNDEAEYWAWSRRLDWSYYTRGPLIAWLIRLSTTLFGGISEVLTGSPMLACRLPAMLSGGLTAWGIFRLGELTTRSRRAAMLAVLVLPAIPVLMVGGVIITCDTPLACCWVWAAVWIFRGLESQEIRHWIIAGLIGALGVLTKYSFLALPGSVGLFLLLSRPHRGQLVRRPFWVMSILCAGLGLVPIAIWNSQHGWAGANQLADRVGLSSRSSWGGIWPVLHFLGGDVVALGIVWWLAGIDAIRQAIAGRPRLADAHARSGPDEAMPHQHWTGSLFLLCNWGVIWAACFVASLLGETEVNWMAPGYLALAILIGARLDRMVEERGAQKWVTGAAWAACLATLIVMHHTEWLYPAIARVLPAPTTALPVPLRHYDPTARMRGHQELARAVQRTIERLEGRGTPSFVLTPTYALASTLEFYLPGQPETYCLGWNFGMTPQPVNQHDLWHPNPRHDPEAFHGRAAIMVEDANTPPSWASQQVRKKVLGRMESSERVTVYEGGLAVGAWDISVCHDYHGIAGYRQNPWGQDPTE
jgi:4-amino-4-deoxy-L-arabinose transferase-like glycosyltransferase